MFSYVFIVPVIVATSSEAGTVFYCSQHWDHGFESHMGQMHACIFPVFILYYVGSGLFMVVPGVQTCFSNLESGSAWAALAFGVIDIDTIDKM